MAKMIAKFMLKDYRPHDDAVAWFDVVDEDGNVESYGITDGSVTGERASWTATASASPRSTRTAGSTARRAATSPTSSPKPSRAPTLLASSICSNGGRSRDLPASRA